MNDKVKQVRVINAKTYRKLNPNDPDWIRITKEIKASPILGSQMLEEFLSYLPVETLEAIWFCIRYDWKIMDEDLNYDSPYVFAADATYFQTLTRECDKDEAKIEEESHHVLASLEANHED